MNENIRYGAAPAAPGHSRAWQDAKRRENKDAKRRKDIDAKQLTEQE